MQIAWLLIFVAFLAGCGGGYIQPADLPAIKPLLAAQDMRRQIVAERTRLWKDVESIRDVRAGEPYECKSLQLASGGRMLNAPASCLCLELNAKNSYGGYVGIRRAIAVFPESGGVEIEDGGIKGYAEHCSALKPFPELEAKSSPAGVTRR